MTKIVQHLWEAIRFENTLAVVPIFDKERPIRSTGDMQAWFTRRPCEPAARSHINLCVFDSRWEASEAFELDRNSNVAAWVKNDHLGFEVLYVFKGVVLKYRPDYLIRLTNGQTLVLEVKGQDSQQEKTKRGIPGRVGESGQPTWGLRQLGMGCFPQTPRISSISFERTTSKIVARAAALAQRPVSLIGFASA
jgi:hypothetical protein